MRGMVAARKLKSVLKLAERAGAAPTQILAALELTEADLADAERLLPQRVWHDLWQEVVRRVGDPALGLRAGQIIDRGYFGVIDYVVRSSATVEHALEAAVRYFPLANTQGKLEIVRGDDDIAIERHLVGDEARFLPPQAAEFALAAMVQLFRDAVATPWRLIRVTFRHPEPGYSAEHRRFFGCPVRFDAETDALVIHASVLALGMRAPDPELRRLVEQHGDNLLREQPGHHDVVDDVRRVLVRELMNAGDIECVATRLGLSRRTLHRRLKEAGTSFTEIRDELRRELAQRYLVDSELHLGEIALLLGYAEASTFHRAFRGWTGESPGAYRERLRG